METVQLIIVGKKGLSTKKKVLLYKPFFRTVSCDQKYCKCMKAEQPEKTHLEESARGETQLRSKRPLLALALASFTCCHETNMAAYRWNSYKEIFPIIIDDRSVGSIRLFPMIDCEILADSQH